MTDLGAHPEWCMGKNLDPNHTHMKRVGSLPLNGDEDDADLWIVQRPGEAPRLWFELGADDGSARIVLDTTGGSQLLELLGEGVCQLAALTSP